MNNGKVNFGDRVEVDTISFPELQGKIGIAVAELQHRSQWSICVIFEEDVLGCPSEIQPSVYALAVVRLARL